MVFVPSPTFELLVSVRYDPDLLASSLENTAIFSATRDQAYPLDLPITRTNDVLISTSTYLPHLHQRRLVDAAKYFGWHKALTQLANGGPLTSPAHFEGWIRERVQTWTLETNTVNNEPLKLRILLSSEAHLSLDAAPVPRAAWLETFFPPHLPEPELLKSEGSQERTSWPGAPSWSVTIDVSPIAGPNGMANPHLHFKTTHRNIYDDARSRISLPKSGTEQEHGRNYMHEILLYNEDGYITEGSLTSVYFWRNGCWVTPRSLKIFGEGQTLETLSPLAQAGTTRLYALAKGLAVESDVPKDSISVGEAVWLSNGVRGFGWGVIR